jgi:LytS/YehU family sensor histidine kinase
MGLYLELLLSPQLGIAFLMLCYLAADALEGSVLGRKTRLAIAVLIASVLDQVITTFVLNDILGLPNLSEVTLRVRASSHAPSSAYLWIAETIFSSVLSAMIVVLVEAWRSQELARLQFDRAEQTRVGLVRRVLQSRLAAMQAQVEPQFLFETLVEIESLYESDAAAAAALLDRLIVFLRVALPGLRECGSSLAAEAELVVAYVCVMQARANQLVPVAIELPAEAQGLAVSPMLLLPLIQRCFRNQVVKASPAGVRIHATRGQDRWDIVVSIETAESWEEDEEIRSVRERLRGLYGDQASLQCSASNGVIEYVLAIPSLQKHP